MKVVKTDDNRPMTTREIEVCQQFEQSDRSGPGAVVAHRGP